MKLTRRFIASSKCGSDWHKRKLREYYRSLRAKGVRLKKKLAR